MESSPTRHFSSCFHSSVTLKQNVNLCWLKNFWIPLFCFIFSTEAGNPPGKVITPPCKLMTFVNWWNICNKTYFIFWQGKSFSSTVKVKKIYSGDLYFPAFEITTLLKLPRCRNLMVYLGFKEQVISSPIKVNWWNNKSAAYFNNKGGNLWMSFFVVVYWTLKWMCALINFRYLIVSLQWVLMCQQVSISSGSYRAWCWLYISAHMVKRLYYSRQ